MAIFIRQNLRQSFGGELRNCIGAPIGAALAADTAAGENDRRIVRFPEKRQTDLCEGERGCHVDMHYTLPLDRCILLNRKLVTENSGVVHQGVQLSELLGNAVGK